MNNFDLLKAVALAVLVICSEAVFACSCALPRDWVSNADKTDAVFTAKVLSVRVVRQDDSDSQRTHRRLLEKGAPQDGYRPGEIEITYKVLEIFKGASLAETRLTTLTSESACGYTMFKSGEEYLIFARRTPALALSTSLCSGTIPLAEAKDAMNALRRRFGTATARQSKPT